MMPRWLLWSLAAILCWGVWAILAKFVPELSAAQVQIFSTAGMAPVITVLAFSKRVRSGPRSKSGMALAFAAGLLGCFGNSAYYGILNTGAKAATVVPLTAMYPLLTIVLAVMFLRERLNGVQIGGVALSLAAIYCFNVQDERRILSPWLLAAFIPILFWGLAGFAQKLSTLKISGELSTLFFLLAFVAFVPLILFIFPHFGPAFTIGLNQRNLALTFILGFALALGNLALLLAFAHGGKASIITPITALYPLVSIPIAILGFGEWPKSREAIGIVLAILAVVAISIESKPTVPESSSK